MRATHYSPLTNHHSPITLLLTALLFSLLLPIQSRSAEYDELARILKQGYAPGELILKLDESRRGKAAPFTGSLERLHQSFGVTAQHELFPTNTPIGKAGKIVPQSALQGIYRLRLDPDADVEQAASAYQADPSVLYAQPNYLMRDCGLRNADCGLKPPKSAILPKCEMDNPKSEIRNPKSCLSPNDPRYSDQWALPKLGWDRIFTHAQTFQEVLVAIVDSGVDYDH
ncbi:MAG: hypothetical protein KAQ78_02425, partial [Candidatus Latescibacteria bacterium]|nr:hypothetical protein [Candidatus Latescibacterota bacterium]